MQNHLFIGLGGQGGRTLGELRKVMHLRANDHAALQQQGVQTEFLAIDSSEDVRNDRRSWTVFGTDLALNPSDWLILQRPGAGTIGALALREDIAPWLGDRQRIVGFLGQQGIPGANQRRRFGRLLFAHNAATIRSAVTEKVNALATGNKFQCAFHIFATLGGGTGSGGLIDLVTLIRTRYPGSSTDEFPIFVYAYVTDTDGKGDVGYFFQNQFTALRDLNALICGRLHPPLLGDDIASGTFSGAEPITQVTLTASLNSANHQIPLETQIPIIAEACFERIVAWSAGQMGTNAQRSLTGEDILGTFPAEPPGRPERSYRFSALGMRRWEVPAEKLTDLLALDLLASALRQMLFNHWHESNGFSNQLADGSAVDVGNALSSLLAEIEDQRRPEPKLETLAQRLRDTLAQQATGLARASGDAPQTLRTIEQDLAGFYHQRFEQVGVEALIQQRQANLPAQLQGAVQRLEVRLTGLWLDRTDPLALARVPQVLEEMGARLRRELEAGPTHDPGSEHRRRILDARRLEWDKLTWLSASVTGRRTALIAAHGADCGGLHEADLRSRLTKLDHAFVRDLLGRLTNVNNRFRSVQQGLRRLLDRVQQERDLIDRDLRDLNRNIAANKYEFNPAALDAFLTWMHRHPEHQQTAAFLMREEIIRVIGVNQPVSALDDGALTSIDDRLRGMAKQQAELIHLDYEVNRQGQAILEGSVLDILKARHETNPQAFLVELQDFLGQAAVCLHLRDDTQPITLLGAGIEVKRMPQRLLLIGLPRHAFTPSLQQAFRTAMAAGHGQLIEVFEHEDPGQIRLLTLDYWLAARFSTVVKALGDKYQATTTGALNPDTTYFCNIDPDGEQGLRPDIFLPDDETMRLRYEAELWLGRQPGIDVVQVDGNGVFLIRQDADGRHADLLGPTLDAAIAGPDNSKMFGLHGRLGAALAGSDRQGFTDLLNLRRSAMEQQHSVTSPQYQRWDRMLTLLKPLVD